MRYRNCERSAITAASVRLSATSTSTRARSPNPESSWMPPRSPITRAGSPAVQGGEECPVRRIVGPGRETGRVSRFRLYPTPAQETALLGHCAQARFGWDLALEQANSYGTAGRKASPNFAAQCRQLAEARAEHQWLAAGSHWCSAR